MPQCKKDQAVYSMYLRSSLSTPLSFLHILQELLLSLHTRLIASDKSGRSNQP